MSRAAAQPRPRGWALISGEYPPTDGGVADYTAQLARALAAAGDPVHVWAPGTANAAGATHAGGVQLHPCRFDGRGRRHIAAAWAAITPQPQLLIQYVPHAYGHRGLNWRFCRWVLRQKHHRPWVMFHEVAFPREPGQNPSHRLLATVTHRMAAWMHRAAARSFVAIPAWADLLRRLVPGSPPAVWLPVPSNLPTAVPTAAAAAARLSLTHGHPEALIVGCFYGRGNAYGHACLRQLLPALLAGGDNRYALLAGAEGVALRQQILAAEPGLAARLHAPGYLAPDAAAAQLAAADLLIQPYPDGVSSRRGTAMAGLALGRALLTTTGRFTEPVWRAAAAVDLTPAIAEPESMRAAAEALLADPGRRRTLGAAARQLYLDRFALEHTVATLRAEAVGQP